MDAVDFVFHKDRVPLADHRHDAGQNFCPLAQRLPGAAEVLHGLLREDRLRQETGHPVFQLFARPAQLHLKIAGVEVQGTEDCHGAGHLPALPCQRNDILGQLAGVELVDVLHLVPLCRGDGVARDGQHFPYPLSVQAQQQGLGGVEVAVTAGHVGQGAEPQLPVHPAGHEGGIHPGPGNGAVRDGQQISSRRLQPLCASQIVGQVGILGESSSMAITFLPAFSLRRNASSFSTVGASGVETCTAGAAFSTAGRESSAARRAAM